MSSSPEKKLKRSCLILLLLLSGCKPQQALCYREREDVVSLYELQAEGDLLRHVSYRESYPLPPGGEEKILRQLQEAYVLEGRRVVFEETEDFRDYVSLRKSLQALREEGYHCE